MNLKKGFLITALLLIFVYPVLSIDFAAGLYKSGIIFEALWNNSFGTTIAVQPSIYTRDPIYNNMYETFVNADVELGLVKYTIFSNDIYKLCTSINLSSLIILDLNRYGVPGNNFYTVFRNYQITLRFPEVEFNIPYFDRLKILVGLDLFTYYCTYNENGKIINMGTRLYTSGLMYINFGILYYF